MLSRRGSNEELNKNHLMTNQTFNIVISKLPGESDSHSDERTLQNQEIGSARVVRIQVHQDQSNTHRYDKKSNSSVRSPKR